MCYKSSFWGLGYDNGAYVEKLLVKLEYLSGSASTIKGNEIQKTRTQRQTLEFKEPQIEYCQMKLRPNLPAGSWLVGTELINMINILTTEYAFTGGTYSLACSCAYSFKYAIISLHVSPACLCLCIIPSNATPTCYMCCGTFSVREWGNVCCVWY